MLLILVTGVAAVILYAIVLAWISIQHNLRTTCRQVFIFHPWCDAGGGGEKCMWLAIKQFADRATRDMECSKTYQSSAGRIRYKKPVKLTILCHATTPHIQDLLNDVDRNFGIKIQSTYAGSDSWQQKSRSTTRLSEFVTIRLVRLHSASLAVKVYPFATQFLQLAAGLLVAFEASLKTRGNRYDAIWDTTGLATTVAWYNWLTTMMRRRCYAYIHYPFLRAPSPTDEAHFVRKLYSKIIAINYFLAGACYRQPVPVNSTYTQRGLSALWPKRQLVKILPPVDRIDVSETDSRAPVVISVAQFRKEKRHFSQIEIIARLLERKNLPVGTRFLICGSCRPRSSAQDDSLVLRILDYADTLCGAKARIELHCHSKLDWIKWAPSRCLPRAEFAVEFHVNSATKHLKTLLASARVGLHTMIDEHLGISVAEMALNKLYVVAHNSAGPRDDILRSPSESEWRAVVGDGEPFVANFPLGALCDTIDQFASAIEYGLKEGAECVRTREAAARFVRARFPTPDEYGRQLLDTWSLYTKRDY